MEIDIESLSEQELIELNHLIVGRIKFLRQIRTHESMQDFRIGEKVSFHPEGRDRLFGTLVRFNRKSVTVITDDGGHWNVPPQLIRKVKEARHTSDTRVIDLFPRGKPQDFH